MKGTHVIENTETVRLGEYDRRKYDLPTDNQSNYSFGERTPITSNVIVLIDEEGKIFYMGKPKDFIKSVDDKIKVVMNRQANRAN